MCVGGAKAVGEKADGEEGPGGLRHHDSGKDESPDLESLVGAFVHMAEDRGFEPLRAFTQHAFQACAIGH